METIEDAARLRAAVARFHRRLRAEQEGGLGTARAGALSCLWREGPMTAGALAARQGLQPQSVTRLLADLDTAGLVTRSTDPADRRRSLIAITGAGVAALQRYVRPQEAWLAGALAARLSETERGVLRLAVALLDRLAEEDPAGR
jgi:DNA-binding MarR family transcriptional regulator